MSRGGKRPNSGPKRSMSPYGETTAVIRVPRSAKTAIQEMLASYKAEQKLPHAHFQRVIEGEVPILVPLYHFSLAAGATTGFASPAQDYEEELDLGAHLIKKKASTFAFRVGKNFDSMIDVGIMPGCHLLIDKSLKIRHGRIVVAAVAGEWVVKRLHLKDGVLMLLSENHLKNYPPILFKEDEEPYIFGVVKSVVTDL